MDVTKLKDGGGICIGDSLDGLDGEDSKEISSCFPLAEFFMALMSLAEFFKLSPSMAESSWSFAST